MRPPRTSHLIVGVLVLSALAIVLVELRLAGYFSIETHAVLVYAIAFFNAAISVIGLWTRHRAASAVYLTISVADLVMIGAATPISGMWILARVSIGA
jgi:hypothetical protein